MLHMVRAVLAGQQIPALHQVVIPAVLNERLHSHSFASSSSSRSTTDSSSSSSSSSSISSSEVNSYGMQLQEGTKQLSSQAAGAAQPRHDLVTQLLSPSNMNRRQQLLQRKAGIIEEFQRMPGDSGSPEVQIALLTDKIRHMTDHILAHKKDHVSKRGMQTMLNQRRKLLSYLRRDNFPRYAFVIHKLGLKDTYAKQERYDKYRVGTRLGTPAEPLKRYGSH